jgi:DNA transformation protein
MPSTPAFRDRVLSRLLAFGPVQARAMFSGYGLYLDGVMFALIARDGLYFKVDEANRGDFERSGSGPFTYQGRSRPVELSYWGVPDDVFGDPLRLAGWAAKAHAAAQRAKAAKRGGGRATKRSRR